MSEQNFNLIVIFSLVILFCLIEFILVVLSKLPLANNYRDKAVTFTAIVIFQLYMVGFSAYGYNYSDWWWWWLRSFTPWIGIVLRLGVIWYFGSDYLWQKYKKAK